MTDSEDFEYYLEGDPMQAKAADCLPREGSPKWPSKGNPVILISERPLNTLPTVRWYISDAKGNPRNQRVNVKCGSDGICRYTIDYESWMNTNQISGVSKRMTINVQWRNGFVSSGTDFVLENPG